MAPQHQRRNIIAIAAAAGAVGIWLAAPEVYTASFSDVGTFIRVLGLLIGLAAWTLVVGRLVEHRVGGAVLAYVPVVIVAGLVLWPYLRPATEVDEAFPTVDETSAAPVVSTTTAPATTAPTTTGATTTLAPTTTTTSAPTTTTTSAPPEPVELRRAPFQGLAGHRGSGDAALYRLADDTVLLRFEEVDIGSGPALNVYLVPGEDQRNLSGGVHVAALTAQRGNQNYTVPNGVDLSVGEWTVLVWCETFDVEVANATLV